MPQPLAVLTDPIDDAALRRLQAHADVLLMPDHRPDTWRRVMQDAAVLVVRSRLPDNVFDNAPRLRGVVRHGVGLDAIPMDSATRHGVPVANVPGGNARAVAEHAVTAMGMLMRRLPDMDRTLRSQGWETSRALSGGARSLAGKAVGILGLGDVGREIAHVCHAGFGMQVLGHQRRLDTMPAHVRPVALDALFAESDFLVLACPLTPETRHIASAARLVHMRPGAYLVNIGRGGLLDTAALVAALQAGRLAGAALDVFEIQPLPPDSPLLDLPGLVLTPHVAGMTQESMAHIGDVAATQALDLLQGRRPEFLVNPETWGQPAAGPVLST
jgi:D-3-phosphoglycerate dehydrogenase